MAKLIIFAIVLVSFALPVWLSTSAHPRRALRNTQRLMLVIIVVWAVMCLFWYPRVVPLK